MNALEIFQQPYQSTGFLLIENRYLTIQLFCPLPEETQDNLIKLLNKESDNYIMGTIKYNESIIYVENKGFLLLRIWPYLTGKDGLNLSAKEAAKIEGEFGNWIVDRLTGENLSNTK